MNKPLLFGAISVFAVVVLVVLALALPFYKTNAAEPVYNGKDSVIAGRGGFLFRAENDDLPDFRGELTYTDEELSLRVKALNELKASLEARGCRVAFVFVPSKLSVYRGRLPDSVLKTYSQNRRYQSLYNALKSSGAEAAELSELFDGLKDKEQLYHTADVTLNSVGGCRVFEAAAELSGADKKLSAPTLSDYELTVEYDAQYPLTRTYRNITGKTVPNRTLTLTAKTKTFEDAGFAYEHTAGTRLLPEAKKDGVYYPSVLILDTGADRACFDFFSAASSTAVYRSVLSADETVVGKAAPELAFIIINETELSKVPSAEKEIIIKKDKTAAPVIIDTTYSDRDKIVIYGACEENCTVKITGGLTEVSEYQSDGDFMLEVQLSDKSEYSELSVTCTADGKEESEAERVEAHISDGTGYKNVTVGKDGHLHYDETLPDYKGETALWQERIDEYVGYLSAKADRIHEVSPDTKLIYVIPPNHLTIYPETAPDSLAPYKGGVSRMDQLVEAFKDNDKVAFIDLKTPLLAVKETAPYRIYNKTDTHWTELGAYYAYRAIMEYIAKDFPAAAPDPLEKFDVYTRKTNGGDMANFLGFDLNKVREEGVFVRSKEPLKSGISKDYALNFENVWFSDEHVFEIDDGSLPTMIMYRDSFSTNLMSFLAEKFSKSVFHTMWEYADEYELYAEMQPDYIIYEFVERGLGGLQ